MRVLIHNPHNDVFGGGELYTYQVAKAVSEFAEVEFMVPPNKRFFENNPELALEDYRCFNGATSRYDYFLDICHINNLKCSVADKNIKVTFFPKEKLKPDNFDAYDDYVAICGYTQKHIKERWGKESKVCRPYSADIKPLGKTPNTIVSIGNFFKEADGHSKGFEHLVEAFKQLPGYKLTLIGHVLSKRFVEEIKATVKGLDISILTDLSEEGKRRVLGESEFYWHANGFGRANPAQTEHFGIAPEEGLKAGCLTYVHKSGGAQEFCKTWETLEDLVRMTKNREGNPEKHNFQTPENMTTFWKELLL